MRRCDRCDGIYDNSKVGYVNYMLIDRGLIDHYGSYIICPDCAEDFKRFIYFTDKEKSQ